MMDLKPRILVVEDHKLAQKTIQMALERFNCQLDIADHGMLALTFFKQYQYNFILMDLGLPDIDGYTITETIRGLENKAERRTPIIALTAHADEQFRQNALSSGMDEFLSKPITTALVKKIIEKYCAPE